MSARRHIAIKSLLTISACVCLNTLNAKPSKLESNSPFLPPGYGTPKPSLPKPVEKTNSQLAKDLEFRGVVQFDGVYQFSFFKKSENRGYWISEGQSENGISVSSFSADSMQVTVTYNGRTESLDLVASSGSPLPVIASSPADPAVKPPVLPGLPQSAQPANQAQTNQPRRRTIPRRRVILPTKKK